MKNVIDVLKERGFIESMTNEELNKLSEGPLKVYCGFDPTGDSLHLGNMVAIMGLAWFQRFGHTPVAVVGGATGMVGDPSGKSAERNLLDEATIQENLKGIRKNLETILKTQAGPQVQILNNYDWYKDFKVIDFLRDVGKHFRMGVMLAKDSVKARLSSDEGLSFTEFSYQILQGYDFYYLFKNQGVKVQLGGSDQWGNITAGTDLVRKVLGKTAHGVTFPLLTKSDGQKFGKSEKGAIWLSKEKLSPYEFYQYLVRVSDDDVIKLMCMLTFMDMEDILLIEKQMKEKDYIPNTAQKRLASEVTMIVHGREGLEEALKATSAAAPGKLAALNKERLEEFSESMPTYKFSQSDLIGSRLVDVIVSTGLVASKGEARRLIKNKGLYLNNRQVENENSCFEAGDIIEGGYVLIAAGKQNKILLKIEE